MNKIVMIMMLLFCVAKGNAQGFVKDTTKYERFKFEAGMFIPLGNLKTKIGISQQYGFWYRTRVEHNDLFDIGFTIIVPEVEDAFTYKGKDSIFNVKTKGVESMFGCRVNKLYPIHILKRKATVEWVSSFGVSFFAFEDKENPEDTSGYYTDENGNESYLFDTNTKALACLYVGQGVGLTSKNFGIQVVYNCTPYRFFSKRIDSDFGMSSLSVLLHYKL